MLRKQIGKFHIGGDLKLRFYDSVSGEVDGDSDDLYSGAGVSSFYLYVNGQLSDRLSVQVEPQFELGETGATPMLDDLDKDIHADPGFPRFTRANFTYRLPKGYEVTAGMLRPRFTLDYGAQRFYHEEFNGSFPSISPYGGEWTSAGAELYKNFDFENFSLPVYLYYLNGSGHGAHNVGDNNEGPAGMIHVEPKIGPLTLLGSFGAGKWDDSNDETFKRWAAGVQYQYRNFTLRSEYMGSIFENQMPSYASEEDAEADGYYVKLFYDVFEDLTLMANYNILDKDFSGFFGTYGGDPDEEYETLTLGATYTFAPSTDLILQYDIGDQEREGGTDIEYDRVTLGTRITW